jgi:hypothetical protein
MSKHKSKRKRKAKIKQNDQKNEKSEKVELEGKLKEALTTIENLKVERDILQ